MPTQSSFYAAYLLAWLVGCGLQLQQRDLWPLWCYSLLLLGALLLSAVSCGLYRKTMHQEYDFKNSYVVNRMAILGCLAVSGVVFSIVGLRAHAHLQNLFPEQLAGRDWRITGVVSDLTQPLPGGVRFALEVDEAQLLATGSRITLKDGLGSTPQATAGSIQPMIQGFAPRMLHLSWYEQRTYVPSSGVPDIQPGQRWAMTVRLKPVHGNLNPHGFDYELWMWSQGVHATGYVREGQGDIAPQMLSDDAWRAPVARSRQWTRERIEQTLGDFSRYPNRGVVSALVLGDQRAIDDASWEVFRRTGVAHLMSISGLHITLFAWLSGLVMTWAWRQSPRLCLTVPAQSMGAWLGAVWALVYALFCGFGVPAQRTVLMLVCAVAIKSMAKRWPWHWVALTCACAVVLMDPWALLSAGFWLSFVAVCVLFVAQQNHSEMTDASYLLALQPHMPVARTWSQTVMQRALRYLRHLLYEQWRVTLALTPLTLLLFQQVSLSAGIANLVAIPVVTLVVTPLALLGVLWPPLWLLVSQILDGLMVVLGWLAKLPFTWMALPVAPAFIGLVAIWGGICLVLPLSLRWRLSGLALAISAFLWQPHKPMQGQFDVWALDVGQGSSVLIQTATHALLYDTGPAYGRRSQAELVDTQAQETANAGQRVVVPTLNALGVRLDMVVLSHGDQDHIGGAKAVLAAQPQAAVLTSIPQDNPLFIEPLLGEQKAVTRCAADGTQSQRWQWDGVEFEVLHPTSDDYPTLVPFTDANNAHSCVLRIRNGERSVLLTGDIGHLQEKQLVDRYSHEPDRLRADVLVVGHHGSKGSSSEAFLAAVQPQWGVIQAGYMNAFAHPASEVLSRLQAQRVQIVQTADCGAAYWRSDKPLDMQCERQIRRRYWYHLPNPSAVLSDD